MNKQRLEQVFSKEYQPALWREVLTQVFGVANLFQNPVPVTLNSNEYAESAFELGSFDTTDDRIIGIYQVNLNDNTQIARNKVGLRTTLRNIYKYDVDGALVVFVQGDKWRLSFISEIRTLDDEGQIVKEATEPKRYTYLLGQGEKVKTSAIRLASIAGKELSLEDIREAFSVEALNEEFYKIVRDYFYQLVGGSIGKGRSKKHYDKILKLPIAQSEENEKHVREFAVRLIGRTIFCWFLKVKESDAGIPLLPESLLSAEAVKKNSNYYHTILERLFFQTLNTPMKKRRDDLPNGCEIIPFLNGGLFEPQVDDFYKPINEATGISQSINTLIIPDEWFAEFLEEISHFNFTADENSPLDIEFSIDPEMLGRIFENLLAEIDPDTGESARKATGSFYTPREIVSYMVDESLIYYLKAKLETETQGFGFQAIGEAQTSMFGNEARIQQKLEIPLENNRWTHGRNPHVSKGVKDNSENKTDPLESALRVLFSHGENEHQFNETETEILIKAIDNCKVLDPACGSGAFPIGVLQRLVFLLGKLDPDNKKWKAWRKQKAIEETAKAFDEGDKEQRQIRLNEINEAFEKDSSDYGRKLFLIERCIYGVDIQPIAAEISKLRCFLTLVVDDTVDETAENRGVRHLPNLEFKFVTADALLKLPQSSLYNSDEKLEDLAKIRSAYLQSYGEKKEELKKDFKQLQGEILDEQIKASGDIQDERAIKLGGWKPFEYTRTDWFDPLWMFGIQDFDIVIGNPPYIKEYTNRDAFNGIKGKEFYEGKMDIWYYFTCHFLKYFTTPKTGLLTFIATNNWVTNSGASKLRNKISEDATILNLTDFGNTKIFASAEIQTMILILENQDSKPKYKFDYTKIISKDAKLSDAIQLVNRIESDKYFCATPTFDRKELKESIFAFSDSGVEVILEKLKKKANFVLDAKKEVAQGIVAPQDFVNKASLEVLGYDFELGQGIFNLTNDEMKSLSFNAKEKDLIKPFYTTGELGKYYGNRKNQLWIIYTDSSFKYSSAIKPFPNLKKHLDQFEDVITSTNAPYGLHRARNEYFFVGEKIISVRKCAEPTFTYTDFDCYVSQTFFVIKTNRINQKYLTAILNSSVVAFWLKHRGKMQGFQYQVDKAPLMEIPLVRTLKYKPFENLVDYILFLKDSDNEEQINDYVPNSHIAEQFEEVIDALVYELYFEEDFRRENIEFIKYAERDFPSIENLEHSEKVETIHTAYQKLRQKDNEIRNNLKLMDIKLADLIMPIKSAS